MLWLVSSRHIDLATLLAAAVDQTPTAPASPDHTVGLAILTAVTGIVGILVAPFAAAAARRVFGRPPSDVDDPATDVNVATLVNRIGELEHELSDEKAGRREDRVQLEARYNAVLERALACEAREAVRREQRS